MLGFAHLMHHFLYLHGLLHITPLHCLLVGVGKRININLQVFQPTQPLGTY